MEMWVLKWQHIASQTETVYFLVFIHGLHACSSLAYRICSFIFFIIDPESDSLLQSSVSVKSLDSWSMWASLKLEDRFNNFLKVSVLIYSLKIVQSLIIKASQDHKFINFVIKSSTVANTIAKAVLPMFNIKKKLNLAK